MIRHALLATAIASASLSAIAASQVVPAAPSAFERVNLRMTVDSCTFVPETVRVRAEGATLKVTQRPNLCLQPGTPRVVDVRLGSLAPGQYRVEVYGEPDARTPPAESIAFTVTELAEIAVVPPPARPLTDYTGWWMSVPDDYRGLALQQSATHGLFGGWLTYASDGSTEWFTLQSGQWTSSTTWTGQLHRVRMTFPTVPGGGILTAFDFAGPASLDFTQVPAEGRARLTTTIDGVTSTRTITRLPF